MKIMMALVVALVMPLAVPAQSQESRPRILVTNLPAAQVEQLRQAAPEVDIIGAAGDELAARVAEADALIGSCSPSLVRQGKKLRWVQTMSAGVEGCASPELADSPIVLTNAKIIMGPEIADHALALLLSLTRGLHQAIPARSNPSWQRDRYRPIELRGKTALVIGMGGIGTQIAERAAAFGMRVIAVDPKDVPFINAVQRTLKPDQLHSVLPEADVIFMAAPHTPETTGALGAKEFGLMKPGAYFINVSRGRTVRTDALMGALQEGRLAGAGLDVTDPEPLPAGHPLWKFENVVITPHIAGQSDGLDLRRLELFKENTRRFAKGLPLVNVVDKRKGY